MFPVFDIYHKSMMEPRADYIEVVGTVLRRNPGFGETGWVDLYILTKNAPSIVKTWKEV